MDENNNWESWEFQGGTFTNPLSWNAFSSEYLSKLDNDYIFKKSATKRSHIFIDNGYFDAIIDAYFEFEQYDSNKDYAIYIQKIDSVPYSIRLYCLDPLQSVMEFNTVNSSDDVVTFTEIGNGNSYVKIDISKLNREASYAINSALGIELNHRLFNNPIYTQITGLKNRVTDLENNVTDLEQQTVVYSYGNAEKTDSLNAYSYSSGKTFITNEYTANYYYALYEILSGEGYEVTATDKPENLSLLVGVLDSKLDFVVGGKIDEVILAGTDVGKSKVIFSDEGTKYLVVLGSKTNEGQWVTTRKIVDSTPIKEKVNELEETINNIQDTDGEKIICPDKFYAVVGQEFNLYYDSLIKGFDAGLSSPFDLYIDIQCPDLQNASNQIGVRRERMWQIDRSKLTASYIGEHDLQITVYNYNGKQIDQKTAILVVSNSTPLSSQKYILCIGDSLTSNGPIVATCGQHFSDIGGRQPIFIGQRTTSGYKHEGYPGYTFGTFVSGTAGYTYRIFDIPAGTPVSLGDKYETNGTQYIIRDIRTEGLDNALRLRCERSSGTNEPAGIGTLRKVSGASSSALSIEYSAYEAESGNPFWDSDTGKDNFTKYREKMGMGGNKFDVVIIMLGTNDCIGDIRASMQTSINNAITLINAILEDAGEYPTKILLQMTPPDANTISSWQVYADSMGSGKKIGYWTNLWNLRKLLYEEFIKEKWAGKVFLGQAALGLDRYYGFPYEEVDSSFRFNEIKEIYHTNSVHPNQNGYKQLGDGYYLQIKSLL